MSSNSGRNGREDDTSAEPSETRHDSATERSERRTDTTADPSGTRYDTRRGVLASAAVAAAGLGVLGPLAGGTAVGDRPASSGGERSPSGSEGAATPATTERRRSAEPTAEPSASPTDPPVVGANLNGRPHRLLDKMELLDASDTTWVRAFLDVRRKLGRDGRPEDDPDVVALRRAARERNCRLLVSLKWDFTAHWGDKPSRRVPAPGSDDERALCRCAARYLAAIGAPVDVVVLGNEPMWETPEADIRVEDPPVVRFTRTAKDYLVRHGDHGDPTYLLGALNRAHDDEVRSRRFPEFFRATFDLVRADGDVDGVDLHLHYDALAEAESMVAVVREALPDATIAATEFSPVWRYARHVTEPVDASEAGARFLRDHDLPAGTTAVEYFERAKRDPLSPGELADFYAAVPWFNVDHLRDVHAALSAHDVDLATFGFLQGVGMRNEDWADGWLPFHINFLYQPALTTTADGVEHTANRHYLDDYRRLAGGGR